MRHHRHHGRGQHRRAQAEQHHDDPLRGQDGHPQDHAGTGEGGRHGDQVRAQRTAAGRHAGAAQVGAAQVRGVLGVQLVLVGTDQEGRGGGRGLHRGGADPDRESRDRRSRGERDQRRTGRGLQEPDDEDDGQRGEAERPGDGQRTQTGDHPRAPLGVEPQGRQLHRDPPPGGEGAQCDAGQQQPRSQQPVVGAARCEVDQHRERQAHPQHDRSRGEQLRAEPTPQVLVELVAVLVAPHPAGDDGAGDQRSDGEGSEREKGPGEVVAQGELRDQIHVRASDEGARQAEREDTPERGSGGRG